MALGDIINTLKLGLVSFVEHKSNSKNNLITDGEKRLENLLEEIKYADALGLDFFGIGEHHRSDYLASSPITILAAAASVTKNITLGTAVSVLSSEDPVRLTEQYRTLDLLSKGRAELMVGRGSFIESFPLFGFNLNDYDLLFSERLDLLLKLNQNNAISWHGKTRAPLNDVQIYPTMKKPLKISIGVGGTESSVIRAAKLGIPMVIAIIGGNPKYFKRHIDLYKHFYLESGHKLEDMEITINFHGYIYENEADLNQFYETYAAQMNQIGIERGWSKFTRGRFDYAIGMDGHLLVGDSKYVAEKIKNILTFLPAQRLLLQFTVGNMPHDKTMNAIRLFATEVKDYLKK